ncbi:MAG: hypothetical protein OHK93_001652 [Ramalina farinacea]|uniref:Uncharacterized protein n=1 Tax=Ramalina farinacea TaxID=258253 RepID=A0AA43QRM7_9LECA|nr:hypothetical protein [Ramalina farinacea]
MPSQLPLLVSRASSSAGAADTAKTIRLQWQSPSGILSILLIVAGDIVGEALDQLSGQTVSPVVFSFGWVSFAVSAFMTAIGVHQLLTPSKKNKPKDKAVNIKSGKVTENRSWVLDHILRDWDYWKPHEVRRDEEEKHRQWAEADGEMRPRNTSSGSSHDQNQMPKPRARAEGDEEGVGEDEDVDDDAEYAQSLRIIFFRSGPSHKQARPSKDRLWCSGVATAVLQHGIAAIPCGLDGYWAPLMIAFIGTILAFTTGALPQFGKEKWDCKRRSSKTVALMRSNTEGSVSDILVVRGEGKGLDLEEMAKGGRWHTQTLRKEQVTVWPWTRMATGTLAACWIVLLITAAGVKGNSWYLLGIGTLGLVQNAFVAGSPRTPAANGVHLEYEGLISEGSVKETLRACGERWPDIGRTLEKVVMNGSGTGSQ